MLDRKPEGRAANGVDDQIELAGRVRDDIARAEAGQDFARRLRGGRRRRQREHELTLLSPRFGPV
jgi:hypothetical protein